MPVPISCPTCGKTGQVPEGFLEKKVRCKGCGTVFLFAGEGNLVAKMSKNVEVLAGMPAGNLGGDRANTFMSTLPIKLDLLEDMPSVLVDLPTVASPSGPF